MRYFTLLDFQAETESSAACATIGDDVGCRNSKILLGARNGDILLIDSKQYGRKEQSERFSKRLLRLNDAPVLPTTLQVGLFFLICA